MREQFLAQIAGSDPIYMYVPTLPLSEEEVRELEQELRQEPDLQGAQRRELELLLARTQANMDENLARHVLFLTELSGLLAPGWLEHHSDNELRTICRFIQDELSAMPSTRTTKTWHWYRDSTIRERVLHTTAVLRYANWLNPPGTGTGFGGKLDATLMEYSEQLGECRLKSTFNHVFLEELMVNHVFLEELGHLLSPNWGTHLSEIQKETVCFLIVETLRSVPDQKQAYESELHQSYIAMLSEFARFLNPCNEPDDLFAL
jgi:hypothetical protein